MKVEAEILSRQLAYRLAHFASEGAVERSRRGSVAFRREAPARYDSRQRPVVAWRSAWASIGGDAARVRSVACLSIRGWKITGMIGYAAVICEKSLGLWSLNCQGGRRKLPR
jgi:hypothetical protein